jgi:hypothetical protein
MLTVCVAPTTTLTALTDAVATTESLLPVTVLPAVKPAVTGTGAGGVGTVPDVALRGATLLPTVLEPQAASNKVANVLTTHERDMRSVDTADGWEKCNVRRPSDISWQRYARSGPTAHNYVTQ